MTDAVQTYRPAEDIAEDIAALVRHYPPLVQSRSWFTYQVADGVVTLEGHIKSAIAEGILLDNLPRIPGVIRVDSSGLFNDEDLRLALGKLLPVGVTLYVDYGYVVIMGSLPARRKPEALIARLAKVPGVRTLESRLD